LNLDYPTVKLRKRREDIEKQLPIFLKKRKAMEKNYKGVNNKVISQADRRAILREALNSHYSTTKIREKTGVKASLSTVQRVIKKANHLKRQK